MYKRTPKILSLIILFVFVFQQSGFTQVATELNIASYFHRINSDLKIEHSRPPKLRYFSYDSLTNNFKVLLDKGDFKLADPESTAQTLLNYFLIGVSLPDNMFWVNLRPDSENQIIDPYLEKTDVGRIMLEADLQLKKDTASLTSPQTPLGMEYWEKLYRKAAELYGNVNITIPTITRPWIIPREIIVKETSDSVYIYKATLKVMLERDYLKDSSNYSFQDERSKVLNEYASNLIKELIIPKLTREVNSSPRYAPLRQAYYSLILARWFKLHFSGKQGIYASLINSQDLTNLISRVTWSKTTYFNQYKKSFSEGEYNIKKYVYTPTQVIRSYISGGIEIASSSPMITKGVSDEKDLPAGFLDTAGMLMEGNASDAVLKNRTPKMGIEDEKPVTVGLIGVGRQGKRHLRHLAGRNDVETLAVDNSMGADVYEDFGSKKSVRLEEANANRVINDPNIKAVVIATPGNTHYALVKDALAAGKHVLVEKPFTETTDEANKLVAMAAERNLILMVGHNRYYLPHLQRLIELVHSGKLGKIIAIEANYLNPPQKNDLTHTALEGLGYHIFYMIHALLGRNHPDELLSGVTSEDWETVGLKLSYGDIPVTVKLDRNYDKEKIRNIIVKGSNFTATFDYSKESIHTELFFEPTHKDLGVGPVSYDSIELEELQKMTPLDDEDAKPSLHHQLKVFLDAIRTQTKPPSDGLTAVSIVETIEQIRDKLKKTCFYLARSQIPGPEIIKLARLIHDRIGVNGGIVAIDGESGAGKTTFSAIIKDIYELMYPSKKAVILSLDEMLLPWEIRSTIKKKVLEEGLTGEDMSILREYGWDNKIDERTSFNNEAIALHLRNLRELFDGRNSDSQIILRNPKAYIKLRDQRFVAETNRRVHRGDVVFVEGKYANDEYFVGLTDIHVRIQAPPEQIREQYEEERSSYLSPDDLSKHMIYYDLFIVPNWERYEIETRHSIDFYINMAPKENQDNDNVMETISTGGVDFRVLPMTIQLLGSLSGLNFRLPQLSQAELKRINVTVSMQQIRNMVQAGIAPSGERVKELIAACVGKEEMVPQTSNLLLCLNDIFKLEEENSKESSPELMEALVIIDSYL